MQFSVVFVCRECGRRRSVTADTADFPPPGMEPVPLHLEYKRCGHTSHELGITQTFRAEYRPSWEREQESKGGEKE